MVNVTAFLNAGALLPSSFVGSAVSSASTAVCTRPRRAATVVAELEDWGAGLKSDPLYANRGDSSSLCLQLEGDPEDLSGRSFATKLPLSWAGEFPSVGVYEVSEQPTVEEKKELKLVPEEPESNVDFVTFFNSIQEERREALSSLPKTGAAGTDSNFPVSNLTSVQCVEYWA